MFVAAAAAAGCRPARPPEVPSKASGKVPGPNDVLRVAVVGVNGRGMAHVGGFAALKESCVVAAICDADQNVYEKARKAVETRTGKAPVFYQDYRKLLQDKSIDVISIATPNHWHSLGAIWAIQAGKDVYLEKPISHNVREGRMVVEFARKNGRICQTGTQSRSNPGMQQFIGAVHAGKIGTVKLGRGLCYKSRPSIGKLPAPIAPPPGVDYDLWLGPAPARADVPRTKFHYDWHWQDDYGNGDVGNQGIHEMDKGRWGLGQNQLPKSVISVGGRFGYEDDGQTPNTQVCFYDFGDVQMIFEVRGLPTPDFKGAKIGNIFYGSDGYAVSTNYNSGTLFDLKGQTVAHFDGSADHFANFVTAVRSRKPTDLNADVLEGHLSSAMCHLGGVSHRLGTDQPLGALPSQLTNVKEAQDAFSRFEEHLVANHIPLDKTRFRLGRELTIDQKTETFIAGSADANAHLTRAYRKGFVVPDRA